MAGNKPINKPLRGIRDSMPPGYLLGRTGGGNGPPILIPTTQFASKGFVANTTIQVNGPAGGDLSGTYPNPTVVKIQGNAVNNTVPSDGQVLTWVQANTDWEPKAPSTAGAGAASIQDNGSNLYIAISDTDGQLVIDASGDPIFVQEVLPPAALPLATSATVGGVEVDGFSIRSLTGVIGTLFCGLSVYLNAPQSISDNTLTTVKYDTTDFDTLSGYNASTGVYTPTKAGKWLVFTSLRGSVATSLTLAQARIFKNAAVVRLINATSLASPNNNLSGTIFAFGIVSMNGSSDTLSVQGIIVGTGGSDQFDGVQLTTAPVNTFGAIYLGG